MFSREFIGQLAECLRALQIHAWRSGKVKKDELRQCRFSAHTIEDLLADMVHVEIDKTGFGSKDQHTRNQFVIRMAFAIRESASALDASQERDVRTGGGSQQLHERDHGADHHTAQKARPEHA